MFLAVFTVLTGLGWWIMLSFTARDYCLQPFGREAEMIGKSFGLAVSMLSIFGYEADRFTKAVKIKNPLNRLAVAYVIAVIGGFVSTLFYPIHPEGFRDLVFGSLSMKANFLLGFCEAAIIYVFFLYGFKMLLQFLFGK